GEGSPLVDDLFTLLPASERRAVASALLFNEAARLTHFNHGGHFVGKLKRRVETFAPSYEPDHFSDLVESIQPFPISLTANDNQIAELRGCAMWANGFFRRTRGDLPDLREAVHAHPSPENIRLIEQYIKMAHGRLKKTRSSFKKDDIRERIVYLEKALQLAKTIYESEFDAEPHKKLLSEQVGKQLVWPVVETPSPKPWYTKGPVGKIRGIFVRQLPPPDPRPKQLHDLFHLAASLGNFVRETAVIGPEDYVVLAQLAVSLQRAAFAQCAYDSKEAGQPIQALKIATLITTLYASGYGDKGWLEVAQRFLNMEKSRGRFATPESRQFEMQANLVLVAEMIRQVQESMHEHFDPLVKEYGDMRGMTEEEKQNFTANQLRSGAVFQLARYVEEFGVRVPNPQVAQTILGVLAGSHSPANFKPHFFGEEGFPSDPRDVGGKGMGLDDMMRLGLPVPPGFVLPPLRVEVMLSDSQKQLILTALDQLEIMAGKKLGDPCGWSEAGETCDDRGLKVYVRGGSAVSMPGQLLTLPDVGTKEAVLEAIQRVYLSWHDPKAGRYRFQNGIPSDWGTAVSVMVKVDGEKEGESGAGIFSGKDYVFEKQAKGLRLVSGQSEGKEKLPANLEAELRGYITVLENYYGHPVEVEFTVESGKLWLLQVRRAHMEREEEIRWYAAQVRDKKLSREEAVADLGGVAALEKSKRVIRVKNNGTAPIWSGPPGIGKPVHGTLAFGADEVAQIQAAGGRAVFVAVDADARESAALAILAGAVLVSGGNMLSHLSAVARQQGLSMLLVPEPVGNAGDVVTLDPANGRIYAGEMPIESGESSALRDIESLLATDQPAR
ncbi:MAG: PEP/pyruvate-binding domain-containing protein, partial [Deltaproteobacteria bacterium]|nr:PEP/pyruvate-binding domain-containing protein [Deltaproteobacteria bacterium]